MTDPQDRCRASAEVSLSVADLRCVALAEARKALKEELRELDAVRVRIEHCKDAIAEHLAVLGRMEG